MSIDGVSGKTSYIGMSILNLRSQLDDLQTQLASGRVSTTYAGQGVNRAFALGLRAQITTIDAYADTATNRQHAHQRRQPRRCRDWSTSAIRSRVPPAPRPSCSTTTARPPARSRRRPRLPTPCRCSTPSPATAICFPGAATDTPPTAPANDMLYGTGTQAGLTQMIDERRQADQGVNNMGRLAVTSPPLTTTVTSVAEDGSAVRTEAAFGEYVADRCDRHPAGRRAAGGHQSISAPSIPTTATRSSSISNLPDGTTEFDRTDRDDDRRLRRPARS